MCLCTIMLSGCSRVNRGQCDGCRLRAKSFEMLVRNLWPLRVLVRCYVQYFQLGSPQRLWQEGAERQIPYRRGSYCKNRSGIIYLEILLKSHERVNLTLYFNSAFYIWNKMMKILQLNCVGSLRIFDLILLAKDSVLFACSI